MVHVPSSLIRRVALPLMIDADEPTSHPDPYHVPLNGERPDGIEAAADPTRAASFAAWLLAHPANSAVTRAMLNTAIDRFVILPSSMARHSSCASARPQRINLAEVESGGRVEEGACWRRRRAKLVLKNRIGVCVNTHRSCVDAQPLCGNTRSAGVARRSPRAMVTRSGQRA